MGRGDGGLELRFRHGGELLRPARKVFADSYFRQRRNSVGVIDRYTPRLCHADRFLLLTQHFPQLALGPHLDLGSVLHQFGVFRLPCVGRASRQCVTRSAPKYAAKPFR